MILFTAISFLFVFIPEGKNQVRWKHNTELVTDTEKTYVVKKQNKQKLVENIASISQHASYESKKIILRNKKAALFVQYLSIFSSGIKQDLIHMYKHGGDILL